MVERGIPMVVGGESHGRLGNHIVFENTQPITDLVLLTLLLLTLAVLAIAVAVLISRGRFRNTASALTGMLTLLAPLLSIFAAANTIMFYSIEAGTRGISDFLFMAPAVAEGALVLAVGGAVGAGAVVLKTILKLVDIRRSRAA